MLKRREKRQLKSEKGFAMLETIVFMMAFVILTAYTVDLFSIIHTGIVNSTAARTYLFETLQHRSNINFLRQESECPRANMPPESGCNYDGTLDYADMHFRFHTVNDEAQPPNPKSDEGSKSPGRLLTQAEATGHSVTNPALDAQNNKTNIVYVKAGYGICLDSGCPQ